MDGRLVIKKSDIENNIKVLKEKVNNKQIYAVLKGNAYGMGLCDFAESLINNGIEHFAVTLISDAIKLKDTFKEIDVLLLTPCSIEAELKTLISKDIVLSVDSLAAARLISGMAKDQNKTAKIHIIIDTGMGRYGFFPNDIDEIERTVKLENIDAEGIFTQLHSAFNKKDKPSLVQFKAFTDTISALKERSIVFPIQHICNSIAIFRYPQMHLTAVRAGSALIGRVSPVCGKTNLCKVGKFYGKITDIRILPKGHSVGYAALYKTKRETRIATVSLGYADGIAVTKSADTFRFIDILRYVLNDFKLLFSPAPLTCLVKGKPAISLGRTGMTNLVLDITDINDVNVGDEVEVQANPVYLSSDIQRIYE